VSGAHRVDPGDLDLRWTGLSRPAGDHLSSERVRDWSGGPVVVALDSAGTRHLLVHIQDGSQPRLPQPVAGLTLAVRRLRPTGQSDAAWIDLASGDPAWNRTFCGLCADIVTELPDQGPPDPATLLAVLERWRRFWATNRDGLTVDEQTGLVGELWLLLEWLPQLTVGALTAWQGPLRGRHDFVTNTVSVEVKTTRAATGPVVHRVARLDQLDDAGTGQLYLLSLRAVPDPLGTDGLDVLLERIDLAAAAVGSTCTALLDERLRAVGVTPADRGRYTAGLRVSTQELYRVGPTFPRLVGASFPTGLPAGVVDVAYSLDTTACQPWLVCREPDRQALEGLT
jgi:hypothetical protein